MALYVARRVAGTLALLGVVVVLTFLLLSAAPGDTALALAGASGADPEYLALLRERLGIDAPLPYQIGAYLLGVLQGDLGFSTVQGQPVVDVVVGRLPATLLLAGSALVFAGVGGVLLGVVAAARRGIRLDGAISVGSLIAFSLPVFWLGQLMVGLFAVRLGLLPAGGMTSAERMGGLERALDVWRHLLLPATALGSLLLALVLRTTRAAMIEALGEDYVTAARGRGIREPAVLLRHALRNALRPVITVITAEVALVLTGAVLVERVFAWPGLGTLLLDSVLTRDTPTLVGILLLSAFVVAVVNLLGDLLYMRVDPRVTYR